MTQIYEVIKQNKISSNDIHLVELERRPINGYVSGYFDYFLDAPFAKILSTGVEIHD